jgi:O-antigen ligase
MILQLAGLIIIAWAGIAPVEEPLPRAAKDLLLLCIAAIALVGLQAVPLPPAVWAALWARGPHERIAEGYQLLGLPMPALPISLAPYASLPTLLSLIPPLAIFCAVVRLNAYRVSWLVAALLAGTIAAIGLGALQVLAADSNSPWYFYAQTNVGAAAGFFSNADHMAGLLLIALPFVAAAAAAPKPGNIRGYSALPAGLAGIGMVLVIGLALNGSLAGESLAVPVLAASALIVLPPVSRWRRWLEGLTALSLVLSLAGLASSSMDGTNIGLGSSVQSREQILVTTGKAIRDYMPLGTGLGSFAKVYRLYESPDAVTKEYVIHANNDYVELSLELGLPGIILLLLFFVWWVVQGVAVWRKGEGGPWARGASIASAAVLVHSLVGFPLRTAAISACFAMCLALLAARQAPVRQERSDLRPTRHVVIV